MDKYHTPVKKEGRLIKGKCLIFCGAISAAEGRAFFILGRSQDSTKVGMIFAIYKGVRK